MKKTNNLVTLRAGLAAALCLSFLLYPPLRVSSAAAMTRAAADLKTESQYRSEASRYDGAIRAIGEISTMKLETGEDLKRAIAILEREHQNLRFYRSKLIVLAISDSTFASTVKKKLSDKQAAEAFARELKADPKTILKLDGAESLVSRMQRSAESDAAVLRRAGERLKEAAERIKKAAQKSVAPGFGVTDGFRVMRAGFSEATQPTALPEPLMMTPQGGPLEVFLIVWAVSIVLLTGLSILVVVANEDDQFLACNSEAEARYSRCVSAANDLPSGFPFFQREVVRGLCFADYLVNLAGCLALFAT